MYFCYEVPNNAPKRIRFEEERIIPRFSYDELYYQKPKSLLNKEGQFFVNISEKSPYVKELVRQAQNLNLTVSGDGTAKTGKNLGDIRNAEKGDQITFGTSSRFDVNWIARDQYFCQKQYAPVYDIVKDWNNVEKAMKEFAAKKKEAQLPCGTNVRFHSRFMVVDGQVIPYNQHKIVVEMPAIALRELICELSVINVKVIRNW
jgi:hypothetical protein